MESRGLYCMSELQDFDRRSAYVQVLGLYPGKSNLLCSKERLIAS
jgi:hypothetical protein